MKNNMIQINIPRMQINIIINYHIKKIKNIFQNHKLFPYINKKINKLINNIKINIYTIT